MSQELSHGDSGGDMMHSGDGLSPNKYSSIDSVGMMYQSSPQPMKNMSTF